MKNLSSLALATVALLSPYAAEAFAPSNGKCSSRTQTQLCAAESRRNFLSTSIATAAAGATFTTAAQTSTSRASHHQYSRQLLHASRITFANEDVKTTTKFDPLGCSDSWDDASPVHHCIIDGDITPSTGSTSFSPKAVAAPIVALSTLVLNPESSLAAVTKLSEGDFNPDSFKPVCAASDSFYRVLQGSTRAVVGDEAFSEYGPLIAGGLLRIRLELCVVESFFNEAVGPFIKENGLSWILPFHETVETFLAGTIFALATTFILVGSTKLIQIIAFYGDLIVGGPCRLFGGFFFDRARGEPVTLDVSFFGFFKTRLVGPPVDFKEEEIRKASGETKQLLDLEKVKPAEVPLLILSGGVKVVGEASKIFREFIEGLDLFVGRYLVLIASGYIILKFIHFKVFPDFP